MGKSPFLKRSPNYNIVILQLELSYMTRETLD
jgi:hypothetical protein